MQTATVLAVGKSPEHTFHKYKCSEITLLRGLGVEGDAHLGATVKHLSRVARDPNQPNLRQVHLIHAELFDELAQKGFRVEPGDMGENIATQGIALLDLPRDTVLKIGREAEIRLTGLRNPCKQIDPIRDGLMAAVLDRDENGNLVRKAGVMAIVLQGGVIRQGDEITVLLTPEPHVRLEPV